MDFWGWVALFVGVAIAVVIIQQIVISNQKSTMEAKLASLTDFNASQKFMGNDGGSGIVIDEDRKKVCLIKFRSGDAVMDVCSYRDLISSEVFEDGNTVTSTSRSSQIGGALVGGIAFEGVGAMIGELSGKTTSLKNQSALISESRSTKPILRCTTSILWILRRRIPWPCSRPGIGMGWFQFSYVGRMKIPLVDQTPYRQTRFRSPTKSANLLNFVMKD